MGAFYNSICLPGDERHKVRESLERWLSLRGFERAQDAMLFDLDGETERSAFLLWNERWTVLVFSKYEEERRLIRDLQGVTEPILYIWVQDSDVWGYDLFDHRGFTGSFVSDAGAWQSFPDQEMGGEGRPRARPEEVCERLGQPGNESALKRIEKKSAAFEEEVCAEFCRLFGVDAAMSSYDDLERGATSGLIGWQVEQLLFVHRSATRGTGGAQLHELALDSLQSGAAFLAESPQKALSPEVRAEMEEIRRRPRWRLRLLRPLFWMTRQWRRLHGEAPSPLGSRKLKPPSAEESSILGTRLVNQRHGCQILLATGAVERPVSGKPASVFAFQVEETLVTCTARPLGRVGDVLRPPNRSRILRDEKHLCEGLPARSVLFELPPLYLAGTSEPSLLGLHLIQTKRALYVFLFRSGKELDPLVDKVIRRTIDSFRML